MYFNVERYIIKKKFAFRKAKIYAPRVRDFGKEYFLTVQKNPFLPFNLNSRK